MRFLTFYNVFVARQQACACTARYCYGESVRLSVCLRDGSVLKWMHISSNSLHKLVEVWLCVF